MARPLGLTDCNLQASEGANHGVLHGGPRPTLAIPSKTQRHRPCKRGDLLTKQHKMLGWTLIFLIVALVAGVLGFSGIAGAAIGIAKIIFLVFLVLFLVSIILRLAK